jgi:hypothetical protein
MESSFMVRFCLLVVIYLLSCPFCFDSIARERTRNLDLAEQIYKDEQRILPAGEHYSFAIDGHLFSRPAGWVNKHPGYYHGGYWIENFFQFVPNANLSLNGNIIALSPAASYGAVSNSKLHPRLNVSWVDNLSNWHLPDVNVRAIVANLDRQTFGTGLTMQEKEMNGFFLKIEDSGWRFKYIFNGTGGFDTDGDIHYYQLDWMKDLAGIYLMQHESSQPWFYSAYSKSEFKNGLFYLLEFSYRNKSEAGLIGFGHSYSGVINWKLKLQTRYYGNKYGLGIAGNIEHDYLSIEQEDKEFTDSMNILSVDDNVKVSSALLNIDWPINSFITLFIENEYSTADYKDYGKHRYLFFRHGVTLFPRRNGNEGLYFLFSNKMSSALLDPDFNDKTNLYSFKKVEFWAAEARFRY